MSNMSYCRFENTYKDLLDCQRALDYEESLSESEKKFRNKLIDICAEISAEYEKE